MKIDNICQADREKQNVFIGYIPKKAIFLERIDKKHGEISLQKMKYNT
jgi:hypothetical protein